MENRQSMVKVENLEVFYGGIQAIHGISLEVFPVSYTHLLTGPQGYVWDLQAISLSAMAMAMRQSTVFPRMAHC